MRSLFLGLLLASGSSRYTLEASLNWHVLAAAGALSLVTGVLFGLVPALQSTRVDILSTLKESRTGDPIATTRRSRVRINLSQVLIAAQIGGTMAILVGAGLFVRTLSNLEAIALGFNRENVLTFHLDARKAGRKGPQIGEFYNGVQSELRALPGVRGVSLSRDPLIGNGTSGTTVMVAGSLEAKQTDILPVGADFFSTMQIPILAGRGTEERDRGRRLRRAPHCRRRHRRRSSGRLGAQHRGGSPAAAHDPGRPLQPANDQDSRR